MASGPDALGGLLLAAARGYRHAGRHAYYYARCKFRFDPVYCAILREGLIASETRVLDLGCGQGLLLSLLVQAEKQFRLGNWPQGWPAAPEKLQLRGIERDARAARWAFASLAGQAVIETMDLRQASLPPCDVVVLLDVLQYLDAAQQLALLGKAQRSLSDGGCVILRVMDASAFFSITLAGDRLGTLLRGQPWSRYHVRPLREWVQVLSRMGFDCQAQPMSAGTPFRNVLLVARRRAS